MKGSFLIRCLCLAGAIIWTASAAAVAQTPSPASIGVKSNLVLVPTFLFDKDGIGRLTQRQSRCAQVDVATLNKLPPTKPYFPQQCDEAEVRFLTADHFHVFEDGVEQKIQSVTAGRGTSVVARDNVGRHLEHSLTSEGKWSTADLAGTSLTVDASYMYRIAYVSPKSDEGSCHHIKVNVDRRNSVVYARSEYCNSESATDPLNGSKFGKQMERDLASGKDGRIALRLQAGVFYANANEGRVDIALDCPWDSRDRQWDKASQRLQATIGLLALIYKKDGPLAERLSDFACCSSDQPIFASNDAYIKPLLPDGMGIYGYDVTVMGNRFEMRTGAEPGDTTFLSRDYDVLAIPSRYEAQAELPPGEYDLQVVLSDDTKFGRAEMPLTVENYDEKQLALSSVVLCRRFRDAAVAAQEAAVANLAPKYVPLVSKGMQFTPAGDTRFKEGEILIPYFEVYEPLLVGAPATTVQAHIRILDAQTGQLRDDFQLDAQPYEQPGRWVIPIAPQILTSKMPKGAYRMEVQATDSAGRTTPWRTANFTIE